MAPLALPLALCEVFRKDKTGPPLARGQRHAVDRELRSRMHSIERPPRCGDWVLASDSIIAHFAGYAGPFFDPAETPYRHPVLKTPRGVRVD